MQKKETKKNTRFAIKCTGSEHCLPYTDVKHKAAGKLQQKSFETKTDKQSVLKDFRKSNTGERLLLRYF